MWSYINSSPAVQETMKEYTSFPEPNGKGEKTGLIAFEDIDTRSRVRFNV